MTNYKSIILPLRVTVHTDLCGEKKIKSPTLDLGYERVFFLTHILYLLWQIDCGSGKCDILSSRSLQTLFDLENPSKMPFFDQYFCSPGQNTESTGKYELLQLSLDVGHDNSPSRGVSGRDHARPSKKRDFLGVNKGWVKPTQNVTQLPTTITRKPIVGITWNLMCKESPVGTLCT